ncbi:TPA: macro domain-containing protein [Klebsiella pneumoniae]|jgi:O-acetyl-ADP-ribose deacetylase (regulator of RNase III)|uniref:Macro domain-containing protein n=1 Tax=Salmonella enterica TaxID=28901 RepID=A0A7H0RWQ7_SALER|nr:macro domain-containing protein [Salmonella enterica]ECA5027329.1 Appr-1-p processing protein [Salmonella enterica subsp. enterica serovar Ohio]ECE8812293.1 Appr-1-p processing protein [Salmonella enterica subsp. enterica serovar Virchow]HAT7495795.1 Appr-1-p processing protein [Raoultella ornithinolytica]HBQ3314890.1 macro domain-containing protein [Klebsiella pneumoniae]HCM9335792.1 macro domain-containing protein [Enterobacter asburiae]HEB0918587.1 macro domain-containing protein [Enter
MTLTVLPGDLFEQEADCLINAWNMNFIPWWLLWPKGVSGRLKQLAGPEPFRQLARTGVMRPGTVCLTDGGKLKTPIIHAAALNMFWCSSESIVHCCTDAALNLAAVKGFHSVAFPLLGSGIGGLTPSLSLEAMTRAIEINQYSKTLDIKIITYRKGGAV